MSDPVVGEVRHLRVDTNDPVIAKQAEIFAAGLERHFGTERMIAILLKATYMTLTGVVLAESPMPEQNIAAVQWMLDELKANVMQHVPVAGTTTVH